MYMARTKQSDASPAEIAGNREAQQAALEAHAAASEDRGNALAEAQQTHAEETRKLQERIADLQAKLDQQRREAQTKADEAGAMVPAQHDAGFPLVQPTRATQEANDRAAREAQPPERATIFKLDEGGRLVALPPPPAAADSSVFPPIRPGGDYIVNGVHVDSEGRPISGGRAPAPEVPRTLESMPTE